MFYLHFLPRLANFGTVLLDLGSVLVDSGGSDLVSFVTIVQKLISLEEALCNVESSDHAAVSAIIDKYSEQPIVKKDSAYHRLACDIPLQAHSFTHVCTCAQTNAYQHFFDKFGKYM